MIRQFIHPTNLRMLQPQLIELESEDFDFAKKTSNQYREEVHKWRTYINALALCGFEHWLNERIGNLVINQDNCSIFQPSSQDINAVCNLRVCEFKLCLLAKESMLDEVVDIPQVALDEPKLVAHFYVVVEVDEEQKEAIIRCLARYDQLDKYRQAEGLNEYGDGNYEFSLSLFEPELNHLLQFLRHLKPKAIPLSPISGEVKHSTLKELPNSLPQKAINTARWLQGEIDELGKTLSWQLLPASTFAPVPMRRSRRHILDEQHNKYQEIVRELAQKEGLRIPSQARGSCKELNLDQVTLQLSVVSWSYSEPSPEQTGEWVLLLILEALSENKLPTGTKLQVSSGASLVSEDVSEYASYLCVAVLGDWDETFVVTIALSNGNTIKLIPFAFEPS
ncbi:MAG: DUF1822 family protein [Symploca sp. SIO2E9]|nr:DUF1822 family protein [Symploca sp. SIO2E9]